MAAWASCTCGWEDDYVMKGRLQFTQQPASSILQRFDATWARMCFRFLNPISQETGQFGTKHIIEMTLYEFSLFSKGFSYTLWKKGVIAFGQLNCLYYSMSLSYVVPTIFHSLLFNAFLHSKITSWLRAVHTFLAASYTLSLLQVYFEPATLLNRAATTPGTSCIFYLIISFSTSVCVL